MNTPKKIALIGGNGGMGKMFQRFLSQNLQYEITIFESDDWHKATILHTQNIVLITTPINITEHIIEQASKYLSTDTILADFTSIKQKPLNKMLQCHKGPVVGLHPIFGPHIPNANEQVMVCCNGRYPEKYKWFIEDIQALGFAIEQMTAQEHDEAMDFIQGIEHFSTYCLGKFLKNKKVDLEKLRRISSPVYKFELNIVGRLFNQAPELYADIIMSDSNRKKHINAFVQSIVEENKSIQNQNREDFIKGFNQTKQWMGDFTEQAYQESDDTLNKQS